MFDIGAVVAALNKIKDALGTTFITVPSGDIDGSNKVYTLEYTPTTGTLQLFLNGALQTGGGVDYTISSDTITFVTAPPLTSILRAYYSS